MQKNQRSVPRTPQQDNGPDTDALAQALTDLALALAEDERDDEGDGEREGPRARGAQRRDLLAAVRKALRKKRDEVLYGAIELARDTDPGAWRLLREAIEEEAATLRIRRDGAPEVEIDAFLVPLFVRSTGGLAEAEGFQDEAAFEALQASLRQLESGAATLALLRHAYDLDEIDRIPYSMLQDMLHEAAASMRSSKLAPAPVLAASVRGWTGGGFAPDQDAMELRFLLGFALKRTDDPFYLAPDDEAGSAAYFAARMARYRAWTVGAAPLVARCLAADPDRLSVNFLYQDLFYGAKEQGAVELAMLDLLARVNAVLHEKQLAADRVHAVVAPIEAAGQTLLRVALHALDGGPAWAAFDKPVDAAADLAAEREELCDALLTLGLEGVSMADGVGADGRPQGAIPYQPYPQD